MKSLFAIIPITLILSCSPTIESEPIVNPADYSHFLQAQNNTQPILEEIEFWKAKLSSQPKGFSYLQKLGAAHMKFFKSSGEIEHLNEAFRCFKKSNSMLSGKQKSANLLTLSELSIMKHDFESAKNYAEEALQLTDEKFGPEMMRFDAYMELGDYQVCEGILYRNKRMDSFDYLVRLGKFKDHEGNLDSAIVYMERAAKLVQHEDSKRSIWIKANLGDMYGHAGRIEDSYQKYLEVLNQDSTYSYALKGIAWIAYSADQNPKEAKRILSSLHSKTNLPDHHLSLAELFEFENNLGLATKHIDSFVSEASKPQYQGMYNKYLIEIHSDRGNFDQALALSKEEVSKRPTPATHDWLAWTLHQSGQTDEAIFIYENNVEDKTEEPDVVYHMAMVYSESGMSRGKDYLREAQEASYELGPLASQKINLALN